MNKLIILVFSLLSACQAPLTYDDETGDNPNVAFKVIAQGQHSNISIANQLVIRNKSDWINLLKINGDNSLNTPEKSKHLAVDFGDNIVIALFAGQQPSGGYSININNIKQVDNNLFVTINFTEPNKNEGVTLALTQPYIMVTTEKNDGKVIFLAPQQK